MINIVSLLKLQRFLSKRSVNNKYKVALIRNQIDFFWSSRLRRSFQIYQFYQKWNEKALRELLKSIRNNIVSKSFTNLNCDLKIILYF